MISPENEARMSARLGARRVITLASSHASLASRPVEVAALIDEAALVGDWIDVDGGHAGQVTRLSIRSVSLRDAQGALHAIPFSQIKIVKNLSRDFSYAILEVRAPFTVDFEDVATLVRAAGAGLVADAQCRDDLLGPIEVLGLKRFE
jgi:small conductance mechanosensitive channel